MEEQFQTIIGVSQKGSMLLYRRKKLSLSRSLSLSSHSVGYLITHSITHSLSAPTLLTLLFPRDLLHFAHSALSSANLTSRPLQSILFWLCTSAPTMPWPSSPTLPTAAQWTLSPTLLPVFWPDRPTEKDHQPKVHRSWLYVKQGKKLISSTRLCCDVWEISEICITWLMSRCLFMYGCEWWRSR